MDSELRARALREYLHVLRQRLPIILAAVAFALLAAGAHSVFAHKSYTSTASVRFQDTNQDLSLVGTPTQGDPQPDKTAAQNAQRVAQYVVALRVKSDLHSVLSPGALLNAISTQVDPSSNLVRISARSSVPQEAADIANGFANETRLLVVAEEKGRLLSTVDNFRAQLKTVKSPATRAADADNIARLTALASLVRPVEVVEPAQRSVTPSSPRPARDLLLAGILGLFLGVAAALTRDGLDRRLRDPEQVEREYALPVVGYVGNSVLGQVTAAGTMGDGHGLSEGDWEAFRIIRSNIGFLDNDRPLSTIAVTSAGPEEGKSTVALWSAHASAVAGRKTLLVECDLRRPVLSARLGVPSTPGLTDFLIGDNRPEEVVNVVRLRAFNDDESLTSRTAQEVPPGAFACVTAGSSSLRPAELLGSKRFADFLAEVSAVYDTVILDTAPVLLVGDTLEVLPKVDALLVCARVGRLTREQVQGAKSALEHFPHGSIGLVVTGMHNKRNQSYYGYYGHYRADVVA